MDASTGKELRRAKVADSVNALAFAANGKLGHGRPITDVTVRGWSVE